MSGANAARMRAMHGASVRPMTPELRALREWIAKAEQAGHNVPPVVYDAASLPRPRDPEA